MAETWKKLAFYDEVPALSDTAPEDVTTAAASAGVATEASRRDHKHDIAVKLNELDAPDGSVAFNSQKATGLATPTVSGDAATKDYVDSLVQGLDWQDSVLDELANPPGEPAEGDRYIIITEATGAWAGKETQIAEWDGSAWVYAVPNEGFCCRVEDIDLQKVYNGAAWVTFGSTVDHGNLNGLGDDDHEQYIKVDGARAFTGDQAMGSHKLTGLAAPATENDALRADASLRAPDSSKLENSTKAQVQDHVPQAHLLGAHTEDTLANLNAKISDATLDDSGAPRDPNAHKTSHQNGGDDEISVAGLSGELADNQPPKTHATSHKSGGSDVIKLNEFGEPTAKVPFAGQQGGDFVLENLAANPAAPVLGKIYFKTGDLHPYVCTAVA